MAIVITATLVCVAYAISIAKRAGGVVVFPHQVLNVLTGVNVNKCLRACKVAKSNGFIESADDIKTGWITQFGQRKVRLIYSEAQINQFITDFNAGYKGGVG